MEFLDLPLLRGDEPAQSGYVAAALSPWPGSLALYASPETTGFELKTLITAPATMGQTLTDLPAGSTSRLDKATRLRVRIDNGQLASATRLQMLGGANVAAIRTSASAWEVLQFETATLVAPQTYELSGFLRGQAGTEQAMLPSLAMGARFVMLDAGVERVELTAAEAGLPLNWRTGPASRAVGDESYAQSQFAFRGVGQRPLSSVRVSGRRTSGDLAVAWIRRTRIGGDPWEAVEVPLGEEQERYEVEIVGAGAVKRTLTATTPSVVYSQAQQTVDFGGPQAAVRVRVYQINNVWGRGVAAEAVI